MLDGMNPGTALFNSGAPREVYNIVDVGIHNGMPRQIDALKFIAVIRWRGQERHRRLNARMQAHARHRNGFLNRLLFGVHSLSVYGLGFMAS